MSKTIYSFRHERIAVNKLRSLLEGNPDHPLTEKLALRLQDRDEDETITVPEMMLKSVRENVEFIEVREKEKRGRVYWTRITHTTGASHDGEAPKHVDSGATEGASQGSDESCC